jgi:hypothetical protein
MASLFEINILNQPSEWKQILNSPISIELKNLQANIYTRYDWGYALVKISKGFVGGYECMHAFKDLKNIRQSLQNFIDM